MRVEEELLCGRTLRQPPAPDEILIKRELYGQIMTAISELPELEQKVIRMFYLEGNSYREIQEALGITKSALGKRLHLAKAKLRRNLQSVCQGVVVFLSDNFTRLWKVSAAKQAGTSLVTTFSTAKYFVISLMIHLTLFTTVPLFDGIWGFSQNYGEGAEEASITVALLPSVNASDSLSLPSSQGITKKRTYQRKILGLRLGLSNEVYRNQRRRIEITEMPSPLDMRAGLSNLPIPKPVKVSGLDEKLTTLDFRLYGAENPQVLLPEPLLPSSLEYLASLSGENAISVLPVYVSIPFVPPGTKRTIFAPGFRGQTDLPVNARTAISSDNVALGTKWRGEAAFHVKIASVKELARILIEGMEVQFADPNLEEIIRDAVGKDEEPLLKSDLARLERLNADGKNIANLSSIEHCANLKRLSLQENEISNISPLSSLTNLQWLNLSSNRISDISPLLNNPGIGRGDEVDLRENPLLDSAYEVHISALRRRGVRCATRRGR